MNVSVIPIVISVIGTISKGLLRRREELEVGIEAEIIQTIALLKLARVRRRVLVT